MFIPPAAAPNNRKWENSTVVEALGKVWLLSISTQAQAEHQAQRVSRIDPLPIKSGEAYTAQYMEAIIPPGTVSRTHVHSALETKGDLHKVSLTESGFRRQSAHAISIA